MANIKEALAVRPVNPDTSGVKPQSKKNPERPPNGFVGIVSNAKELDVVAQNGILHVFSIPLASGASASDALPQLFKTLDTIDSGTHWRTFGAAGLNGEGRDVAAESWMQRGISTILFEEDPHATPDALLKQVIEKHTHSGTRKVDITPDGRVHSSRLTRWTDYRSITPEAVWNENINIIKNVAVALEGTVVIDDNTTAQAGGVAGMNHPKQRFIDDFNETEKEKIAKGQEGYPIDYRWMLTDGRIDARIATKYGIDLNDPELLAQYGDPDPEKPEEKRINIFKLTKKRHVILQNDAESDAVYTEKDDKLYHAWSETQYELHTKPALEKLLNDGENIVLKLEDQQTWGKIRFIRRDFPDGVAIIARNHIHSHAEIARDPLSQQYPIVQSILRDLDAGIDLFMAHRSYDPQRDEFLFRDANGNIDRRIADKTLYAEASFDDLDGLGRHITDEEKPILYVENNYNLYESGQTPDNFDLPGIGIYARDDESKDKLTGMLAYTLFARQMETDGVPIEQIPPYRDIAMGSADDPSGERIHAAYLIGLHPELIEKIPAEIQKSFTGADNKVVRTLQEVIATSPWIADKIKKYRFSYDQYDDRNRHAIEETCEIAGQYSSAEACEDQISRWIKDGTFVVTSKVGGMPPQVEDNVSGKIVEKTGDQKEIAAIAQEFYHYFTTIYPDPEKRAAFRKNVQKALKPQYTTVSNVARELGAAALVRQHKDQLPSMVQQHLNTTGQYPFVHDLLDEYKPKLETPTFSVSHVVFSVN